VDSGVFAPVLTFQKLFEDEGVPITSDEVRGPMGVHKRVHIFISFFLSINFTLKGLRIKCCLKLLYINSCVVYIRFDY